MKVSTGIGSDSENVTKAGNIDLHTHSSVSDGTDSPADLIRHILESGIETFALTDHDAIEGALEVEEILRRDKEQGMKVPLFFRGIEFSCISEGEKPFKCHILGYCYDPENERFCSALRLDHDRRLAKIESRLDYLKEKGIVFDENELKWLHDQQSPGKPHIASLMLRHGYAKTMQEAIDQIRCKEKIQTRIPARMAIEGILAAGGIPVWAHPLGGEGEDHLPHEEFQRRLSYLLGSGSTAASASSQPCGIRGIECWYSRYDREEVEFLLSEAGRFNLLVSGGSDYHGGRKNISLGELNSFGQTVAAGQLTLAAALRKTVS